VLHAFDAPVMEVNCDRRQSSTVATQSLLLMNSQFVLDQAARFAQRLQKETPDAEAQVTRAWQLAFCRKPTPGEKEKALEFLSRQVQSLQSHEPKEPTKDQKSKDTKPAPTPQMQALTDLCQALLSANEFLYVD
jgi:hypothetical protein